MYRPKRGTKHRSADESDFWSLLKTTNAPKKGHDVWRNLDKDMKISPPGPVPACYRWPRIDLSLLSVCHVHVSQITQEWPRADPPTICFGWATAATQLTGLHGYWPIPHAKDKTDAPDTPAPPPATLKPPPPPPTGMSAPPFAVHQTPWSPLSSSSSNATSQAASYSLWGDICCVTTGMISAPHTGGLTGCRHTHTHTHKSCVCVCVT